jgi:GT2 family glycosyltransferase
VSGTPLPESVGPDADALPPVSIGVVTHDSAAEIGRVLRCIDELRYPEYEVLVVDNGSTDDTLARVEEARPGTRVERLPNRGPNPARNYILDHARHRYALLVDDDVVFEPDTLAPMVRRMLRDPGCGTVMPRVVFHQDPETVQYGDIRPHFLGEVAIRNGGTAAAELDDRDLVTPIAPGLFLLVDREKAREIGGFDDYYFFGKTDSDFTLRMSMAGYRNVEVPEAVVRHDVAPRGLSVVFYQLRNRWYWLLKLFSLRTLAVILPALLVHEAATLAFLLRRGRFGEYLRAAAALLRSLPAVREERRKVQRLKRVPDRELLTGQGIEVRADLVDPESVLGRILAGYDRAMELYWRVARKLV